MNIRTLSSYVLRALAAAQIEGRTMNLATLVAELNVRRGDVRSAVSALHREGYVNALRMRLTLQGFLLGHALMREELPPLRVARPAAQAINAA